MLRKLTSLLPLTLLISCIQSGKSINRLLQDTSPVSDKIPIQIRFDNQGRIVLEKIAENSTDRFLRIRTLRVKEMNGSHQPSTTPQPLMRLTLEGDISVLHNGEQLDCQGTLEGLADQNKLTCKPGSKADAETPEEPAGPKNPPTDPDQDQGDGSDSNAIDADKDAINQLYAMLGPADGGHGTTVLFAKSKDPEKAGQFREINYRISGDVSLTSDRQAVGELGYRFSIQKLNVIAQIGNELPRYECLDVNYTNPSKCQLQREKSP